MYDRANRRTARSEHVREPDRDGKLLLETWFADGDGHFGNGVWWRLAAEFAPKVDPSDALGSGAI